MTFVFVGALGVALLVLAPIAAHLLRVRRAQERPFPPTHLVPASPPATRKRRKLEDRVLFGVRVLAILALALLGAVPLVQCSRLAVFRTDGASVALVLVVDDSMSMRVRDDGELSRLGVAKGHALDLVAGAQKGDSIAVVLAGDPARVALAPTSDFSVAEAVVVEIAASDRATDLDGAIGLATSLISSLPQPERRVVVLSDLCDGHPEGTPVGEGLEAKLWIPPLALAEEPHDCAILHAEERSGRVVARVACTGPGKDLERSLVVRAGSEELGRELLRNRMSIADGVMDIEVTTEGRSSTADVVVIEGGSDFIAENDRAPVAHQLETSTIGVLSDRTLSRVETGGPPPVEQALAALQSGAMVQPIPTVPDAVEDLAKYSALVLDDPPGLTPEARDAVRAWLLQGGVALVGLGPRAARAPLGASLDPFVPGVPRWLDEAPDGVKAEDAAGFGPSGSSLERLASKGRTQFETDRLDDANVILRWSDGLPFVIERPMGRGLVYLVGLPFNPSWSDFPLRPAFLALLSRLTEIAKLRGGGKRIEVGQSWVFEDVPLEVRNAKGPYPVVRARGKARVSPDEAGRYDIRIDGEVDTRFAVIPAREVDLRPRKAAAATQDATLGAARSSVDVSPWIALVLLGLLASELALRTLRPEGRRSA